MFLNINCTLPPQANWGKFWFQLYMRKRPLNLVERKGVGLVSVLIAVFLGPIAINTASVLALPPTSTFQDL